MAEFLTSQLDYVHFVYGLALVLLGGVAATIPRGAPGRLPWGWLAGFAFTHGVVEWLRVAELAAGTPPLLALAVTVLVLASYLCLLEFARRSHRILRGSGPGPWLTWLGAAAPLVALVAWGTPSFAPAVRLLLALPATLWTAIALEGAARRTRRAGGEAGGTLDWAALFFAVHGLAAGLVVQPTTLLPAGWPTTDAFLAATGVPVQIVRGVAIGSAALAIWAYATTLDPNGRVIRKRWGFFWGSAAILLLVLGAGWLVTDQLGRQHDHDLQADTESESAQVQDHLLTEMEEGTRTVQTMQRLVGAFGVAPAIARGGSPELDALVDAVAGGTGAGGAYVVDPSGTVVAASDRGSPGGFLGQDHATWPSFREVMDGSQGSFVGLGVTSGKPGYHAAGPIRDAKGDVVGIVAVRRILDRDSFGPLGKGRSFLVGPDGQVLLATSDGNEGRRMWAPGAGAPAGEEPLLAAPWTGTTWARIDGARHVAVRAPLPPLDWSVVTLRAETLRGANRMLGILIALLLGSAIVASFVILQRQLGAESRLAQKRREAEGRAREMARKADTDALTGIANRQGFNEAIAREFARGRRFRHPLAIVLVDLDHFKRVNDEHGHPVGDQVLASVARLLSTRVRESDFVARWGGEEFAIIAAMTDAAGAARLAEKLRALMEVSPIGAVGIMTASFGVAEMRPDDTVQSMLQRADEALYAAKEGGRNQVRCAEAWVDMDVIARAEARAGQDAGEAGRQVYVETGHAPIDQEHREITATLAGFVTLVDVGETAVVRPAMASLVSGFAAHFASEEGMMRRSGYPSRSRHEEAHMLFIGDAKRFQAELERNGVTPGFRQWATTRLPEWFRYHILAHDIALGRFLSGVTAPGSAGQRDSREVV